MMRRSNVLCFFVKSDNQAWNKRRCASFLSAQCVLFELCTDVKERVAFTEVFMHGSK